MSSEAITRNDLKDIINGMLPIFYPVGSYYETSDIHFNPNTEWGGVWELEIEGQVHVSSGTGYDVSGAETNTSDGGSKYLQAHTHSDSFTLPNHVHTPGSHTHGTGNDTWDRFWIHKNSIMSRRQVGSGGTNRGYAWTTDSTSSYDGIGDKTTTGTPSASNTGNPTTNPGITGSVGAVSGVTTGSGANMPPYIVVNRWHRIK